MDINAKLTKINEYYQINIAGDGLAKLYKKYNGACRVKISAPSEPGTDAQNNAMHSLLTAYYKTNMHSMDGGTLDAFKLYMKIRYGKCVWIVIDGVNTPVPYSWSVYTKAERMKFIDGLISEIHQSGAYTESYEIQQIIEGMAEKQS